ncbi:DNA sulfur modification protein DndD [Ectothiorhodospira magna]|uniref:DNA sulfur modification protein DndD n=1 Tax=Ectothiorhodospira magna TaxID=867345 RepID=A0A1H9DKV8_9GAMM|nr:AAA family ATPase [Ectothiorhodospira magna]SEQ14094.1 DNA sulfur modification protein DndD [Ectothiorhodospira magna]
MKLISAKIRNFRLLKKLDLDFSTDKEKRLTVIRAANETGKTTTQNALIWCLYGSKALPQKGAYSLFPSDEDGSDGKSVQVSVEIEFELAHVATFGKGNHQYKKATYRLVRVCSEGAPKENTIVRNGEVRTLWKVTPNGTEKVNDNDVHATIHSALPESLKDVYFTDGDSAMSFIEAAASQGVKRKRVANAIEALLGLNIIDKTISHLSAVSTEFAQQIDNKDYAKELEKIDDRILGLGEDIDAWSKELDECRVVLADINKGLKIKDSEIDEALTLGDKDKLVQEKQKLQGAIKRNLNSLESAYKEISRVASCHEMAMALLQKEIEGAKEILNDLNQAKQLPKVNVPILEELLDRDYCFCGSDLRSGSPAGDEKRRKIAAAIEASRESDLIQEAASSLFYRIRSSQPGMAREAWLEKYSTESQRLMSLLKSLQEQEEELEVIEENIKQVQDSQLIKLREQRDKLREEQQRYRGTEATRINQIGEAKVRLTELEEDRQKVGRKLGKTNTSASNWDVSNIVKKVFVEIKESLRKEELGKVSKEMNRIFLSMIGSDSEKSEFSMIRHAELTEEFDIMVYGPNGHILNPDQDLNGASRRAITLAFILALTKVSEVEAPNIIDTPLGMMAGYVKQSVLLNAIREGNQIILFLTHDEIMGVEGIIDKYAGMVYTLTNPAHYPKMLLYKPEVKATTIVRCECDHHMYCRICQRRSVEIA